MINTLKTIKVLQKINNLRKITIKKRLIKAYSTNVGYTHHKTIAGDKVIPLNESTLTGRMILYLNDSTENQNRESNWKIEKSEDQPKAGVFEIARHLFFNYSSLTNEQLTSLLQEVNGSAVGNKREYLAYMSAIDVEFARRAPEINVQVTFEILNVYMQVASNTITASEFYWIALTKLAERLNELNLRDLLKFMFYAALGKKDKRAKEFIRRSLALFDDGVVEKMSVEDLCVVCNSTFKTGMKMNKTNIDKKGTIVDETEKEVVGKESGILLEKERKILLEKERKILLATERKTLPEKERKILLEKIVKSLQDNLYIMKDPALFITLIKTIRQNRFQDEDLLSTITYTIFFNKTTSCYSFGAICHILALYADYFYYEKTLLEHFVPICLGMLKSQELKHKRTYVTEGIRAKDLKRFLWVCSNLGYYIEKEEIETVIIPDIKRRIKAGEYDYNVGDLIESVLYLWILDYRDEEFVSRILKPEVVAALPPKSRERLNVLLTAIQFENRSLYKKLGLKQKGKRLENEKYQLEIRPVIQKVLEGLNRVDLDGSGANKFVLSSEVPYLNILGITGFKKNIYKAVFVEVLDDFVCVKNQECRPNGLMEMKLRILRAQLPVVTIDAKEFEELSVEEAQEFLREEINLVI